MVIQISGSVGLNGRNMHSDVKAVQQLLNLMPGKLGGPEKPIAVDGLIGPETIRTITYFQKKNFGWGDGRVDPNGQTLSRLNGYADLAGQPNSPLASMANKGVNRPQPNGNAIDNYTTDFARIISVFGTAVSTNGPVKAGDVLLHKTMVWTGKNSTMALFMNATGKTVFVPASSMLIVGQDSAVPLAQMQYSKNGAMPYYQSGNGNPVGTATANTSKN